MGNKKTKSNKKAYYIQCTYESETDEGKMIGHAFLPEKYAEIGRVIYFGKKTSTPDRLWTVVSVGDIKHDSEYVHAHERDYKTQRLASDI